MIQRRFLHPLILLVTIAYAAIGLAAFGVTGMIVGLVLGYLAGLTAAVIIRHRDAERIDPFALGEPWRFFVRDALQARNRFRSTVDSLDAGPISEHLHDLSRQVDAGVDECWRIARRGQAITDARRTIKRDKIQRQLDELGTGELDAAGERRRESLESQIASSDHLGEILDDAERRLTVLDTRLEQSVTRAIDVAARLGDDLDLTTIEQDMNDLVGELESLRNALDDAEGPTLESG